MYQLVFGRKFLRLAEKLDKKLKLKLKASLDVLSVNPFSPILHTKPLTGKLSGCYSFRLGGNHRTIFKFVPENVILLIDVDDRKDIYR